MIATVATIEAFVTTFKCWTGLTAIFLSLFLSFHAAFTESFPASTVINFAIGHLTNVIMTHVLRTP